MIKQFFVVSMLVCSANCAIANQNTASTTEASSISTSISIKSSNDTQVNNLAQLDRLKTFYKSRTAENRQPFKVDDEMQLLIALPKKPFAEGDLVSVKR